MRAELLEDAGEASASADFFRSPEFLRAEGTTHSLRVESDAGTVAAPLLVSEVDGSELFDATSPYGYPGFAIPSNGLSDALSPEDIDFTGTGLLSVFLRHVLGADLPLAGATARNLCLLSDPALPRKSRMSDRQQIRKNLKRGYEVEFVPGPESGDAAREGFFRAYIETMERTQATERYFFSREYFDQILGSELTWLALARDGDGTIAAASIAVSSDGLLHYYLSGTADSNLRDSPMKNVIEAMIEFGDSMDLALNLGGGITPGDPLEEFKRGFTNREEQWYTSELVCDEAEYARLSPPGAGDFFPAYRAS